MDPQTKTSSPDGDTGPAPEPRQDSVPADAPERGPSLSVVQPAPEPTAAALPVASALDARFLTLAATLTDLVSARFGRDASDRVLAETANRLQATLRPTDLLGRLEDERLCALCLGVGDSQSVLRIAERIRSIVASPLPFEPVIATASVGAALTAPGGDPEAVLRRAARAAQAVKRRGGNAAFLDGI